MDFYAKQRAKRRISLVFNIVIYNDKNKTNAFNPFFKLVLWLFSDGDDVEISDVVFAHQSSWQQHLLQLFGSFMCLIDATYKTTCYELPLLVLAVPTNVGFFAVATFVINDECSETILAALHLLQTWNPDWSPRFFMSDFSDAQIAALETAFPGLLHITCTFDVSVLLYMYLSVFYFVLACH